MATPVKIPANTERGPCMMENTRDPVDKHIKINNYLTKSVSFQQ